MEAVFVTVLNMSITGGMIIAALAVLRLMLKKLPRRYSYVLWAIPAIRLLCPISISSVMSFFNLLKPKAVEQNRMEYIVPQATEYIAPTLPADPVITVAPPTYHDPMEDVVKEVPKSLSLGEIAGIIWAAVAVGIVIWAIVSYISVAIKVKGSVKSGEYYICKNICSPFVFGIMRPGIYIPEGLSGKDINCILEHEKTHIRRKDYLVKLLTVPVLALHWFNPLVWLGIRLMTADMELSCDELALKNYSDEYKKDYANALLNVSMKQNGLNGVLGFGESGVKTRIKSVLKIKKPTAAATCAAIAVIAVAAVCLLTNATGRKKDGKLPDEFDGYLNAMTADIPYLEPDEAANPEVLRKKAVEKVFFGKEELDGCTALLLGEEVYRDSENPGDIRAARLKVGISVDGKTVGASYNAPAEFIGASQEHFRIENYGLGYLFAYDLDLPIVELCYHGEKSSLGAFYAVKNGEPWLLMGDMSEIGGESVGVCFKYTSLEAGSMPNTLVFNRPYSDDIEYVFDFDSIRADEYTDPHFTARYVGAMSRLKLEGLAKMYFLQEHIDVNDCQVDIVQYNADRMSVINITATNSKGQQVTEQYSVNTVTGTGWDHDFNPIALKSAGRWLDVEETVSNYLLYERLFVYDSLSYASNNPADGVKIDGEYYFPVTEEDFTEYQQLYDFMHGLFTDEIAEENLSDGHYREYNGKTYSLDAGGISWYVSRDWKSVEDASDPNNPKLEVYRKLLSEGDEGEYMITVLWLTRYGNSWKINSFETHYSTDDDYETLINLDSLDGDGESAL